MKPQIAAIAAAVTAAGAFSYLRWGRPWQLTWGATPAEVSCSLPGDDLVANPTFNATRAITMAAPPQQVWPWLAQVGVGRAGWYSYDLLDNLGRPSARTILDEHQDLEPGDIMPMSPDGKAGIEVLAVDPPHSMVWGEPGVNTWVWVLEPLPDDSTRLISRIRQRYRWLHPSFAFSLVIEFADIWMIRKMMRGIKERAEAMETPMGVDTDQHHR